MTISQEQQIKHLKENVICFRQDYDNCKLEIQTLKKETENYVYDLDESQKTITNLKSQLEKTENISKLHVKQKNEIFEEFNILKTKYEKLNKMMDKIRKLKCNCGGKMNCIYCSIEVKLKSILKEVVK